MKNQTWLRTVVIVTGVIALCIAGAVTKTEAAGKKYKFLVVSHMGANDSNSKSDCQTNF